MEMGTKDADFVQLNQLIGRKTGGISIFPSISSRRGRAEPSSHMIIRGKAMASQVQELFDLVRCLQQFLSISRSYQFYWNEVINLYRQTIGSLLDFENVF
jgi:hypothetical protein